MRRLDRRAPTVNASCPGRGQAGGVDVRGEVVAQSILIYMVLQAPVVRPKSGYANHFAVPSACCAPNDSFTNRRNIFFWLSTLPFARRGFGRLLPSAIFVPDQVLLRAG
jgi:hypothetical protein